MGKHKTYTFDTIPFDIDYKKLNDTRLLTFFKKLSATENRYYNSGYCCECRCFHYLEEAYRNDEIWPKEKWEKIKAFYEEVKAELNKRGHIIK